MEIGEVRSDPQPSAQYNAPHHQQQQLTAQQKQQQTEELTKNIKAISNRLGALRSQERKEKRQQLTEDLSAAWDGRELANAATLARLIGATGLGVANRNYRSLPSFTPRADEWGAFVARAPADGGLAAVATPVPEFASWRPEHLPDLLSVTEPIGPPPCVEGNALKAAKEDLWTTTLALAKAKKRKYAVQWSAPAEVWAIALQP